ncbi:putative regulatory protein [Streptomyces sp. Tu6071]|nr:ATP-binding protein [Streptomyces sp. CLI2509]EGJ74130.1 putative regulatory protein [Streptomyces sp. Tu6071]
MPDPAAIRSWHRTLPHSPQAVPLARALVREALAGPDRDTAELLTAELVANAVEHTEGYRPVELYVELLASHCQVEVLDSDPAPPGDLGSPVPLEAPDPLAEGGRGLLLIRALAAACGHRPTDWGKAVWFRLAAPTKIPPQRDAPSTPPAHEPAPPTQPRQHANPAHTPPQTQPRQHANAADHATPKPSPSGA